MPEIVYRLFFDNTPADQGQLDRVEEITVEQQVDMAWEARLLIPVCVNEDGRWEGEEEAWMRPFTRARVEIKLGDSDFVPLIDGPVVGNDTERSAIPGKSMVTLVVHDDSALLNREEEITPHEGTDSDIARQLFQAANLGGTPDIDPAEAQPSNPSATVMQRGTKMQLLRSLARRHGDFHAYVLPGREPGQSIGCFKRLPTQTDGLPPLILIGEDRNLASFDLRHNARSAADVSAATLSIRDKTITTSRSSYRDARLIGDEPATGIAQPARRRLPPGQNDTVDLDSATAGAAADSGFSLEATGSVLPLCYTGVLAPYRMVEARISDSKYSAKYVIFKVTHTLTRSQYTQSFTVRGNATSSGESANAGGPQPSANLSASFNVQVSIF